MISLNRQFGNIALGNHFNDLIFEEKFIYETRVLHFNDVVNCSQWY